MAGFERGGRELALAAGLIDGGGGDGLGGVCARGFVGLFGLAGVE